VTKVGHELIRDMTRIRWLARPLQELTR